LLSSSPLEELRVGLIREASQRVNGIGEPVQVGQHGVVRQVACVPQRGYPALGYPVYERLGYRMLGRFAMWERAARS